MIHYPIKYLFEDNAYEREMYNEQASVFLIRCNVIIDFVDYIAFIKYRFNYSANAL